MKCLPNFDEETIKEAGSDFLSQQRTYSSYIVTDLFTITSVSIINCNVCDQKTIAFQNQVFPYSKIKLKFNLIIKLKLINN